MKPIIVIPGIEATSLVDSNTFDFEIRWNAFDTWGTAIKNKITGPIIEDKLQLIPEYDENINRIIERNHLARLPYERAISNISSKFPKDPVYLFGYDWRMSNVSNGNRLFAYVEYLKQKLSSENVEGFRFITHSMGGLVFSCYLNLINTYTDIDKVVMCAPPFRGSPLALVHMVKGDGGIKGFFRKIFGQNDDIRKVVRTYPSLFEILPWYEGGLKFSNGEAVDLIDMKQWQRNIWNDDKVLFASRLEALSRYRMNGLSDFSNLPAQIKRKIIVLAGTEDKTIERFTVQKSGGPTENYVLLDSYENGSGDGTVPVKSSTHFKNEVLTLELEKKNLFQEFGDAIDFHGMFLTDSRVQNIVVRFFDNSTHGIKLRENDINWWASLDNSISISGKQ